MPITYRRPGVYLEESLLVNTSTTTSAFTVACFVGVTEKGPVLNPYRIDSWSDFVSVFGGFSPITPPTPVDPNNVSSRLTSPVQANLTALKAHTTYGDGLYATPYGGSAFTAGQYVELVDNSKAHFTPHTGSGVWVSGAFPGTGQAIPSSSKILSYLPFAVYSFFQSGGRTAWIIRAISEDEGEEGAPATIAVNGAITAGSPPPPLAAFNITALSVGVWGNKVKYALATQQTIGAGATAQDVFSIQIYVTNSDGVDEVVETFSGLSVTGDISGSRRADVTINDPNVGSQYVRLTGVFEGQPQPVETPGAPVALAGGEDPGIPDPSAMANAAADLLTTIEGPVMINIVGYHSDISKINTSEANTSYVSTAIPSTTWSDRDDVFVINDSAPPRTPNQTSAGYKSSVQNTLSLFAGDSYVASYTPWILVPHPQKIGEVLAIPPAGAIMGVAARIDSTVGVFRAPAGIIAGITNAVGVQTKFTDTELGDLNQIDINVIRSVPGAGICVMGARTRKSFGVDHYVSARRTLIYIKEILRRTTQFAVFENNDQRLWSSLRMAAERILRPLWEAGGLKGASTNEAYFIRCDDRLNSPSVIASGEVRMEVGVALQYPAEFVIIRITQYDRGTFSSEVVPSA